MLAAAVGLECWYAAVAAAVAAAADASFKVEAGSDMYMEMSQLRKASHSSKQQQLCSGSSYLRSSGYYSIVQLCSGSSYLRSSGYYSIAQL